MRRRIFVVLLASAAVAWGIDVVGLGLGPTELPDRTDGAAGDASDDGATSDGATSGDADLDACSCPLGFACSDAGCTDFARTHFTLTANPSGPWSWGSRDRDASAGAFVPYTIAYFDPANGIEEWSTAAGAVTPGVFRNPSAMTIHPYGSFTMTPSQLAFHPGPQNQRSIVRWTAPEARAYGARIAVVGLSGWLGAPPTTTGVTVTKTADGATTIVASVNVGGDGGLGDAGVGPFTIDIAPAPFAPGDVLDVAVDFGTNGNHGFDSTGVDVTIHAF